jgi:hypothetical protein
MELKLCPFCGLQYCKHQALFPFKIDEWNSRPIEDKLEKANRDLFMLIEEHGGNIIKAHASQLLKIRSSILK